MTHEWGKMARDQAGRIEGRSVRVFAKTSRIPSDCRGRMITSFEVREAEVATSQLRGRESLAQPWETLDVRAADLRPVLT